MKFLSAVYEKLVSTKRKTRRKIIWLLQKASSLIQKKNWPKSFPEKILMSTRNQVLFEASTVHVTLINTHSKKCLSFCSFNDPEDTISVSVIAVLSLKFTYNYRFYK